MTKKILAILFAIFLQSVLIQQVEATRVAQQSIPELRTLSHNAQLGTADVKAQLKKRIAAQKTKQDTVLTLPFIDDFSNSDPFPDPTKWKESVVFINRTFGIFPPTTGVATFDALDENGEIYKSAPESGSVFEADILTSQTIRLDSIFTPYPKAVSVSDSIVLSFYFQPGGGIGSSWSGEQIGYRPAFEDRLVLEFYVKYDTFGIWSPVWETAGMSLKEMCPICDSAQYPQQQKNFFTKVVIPMNQQYFYSSDFKFRFKAYSSINSSLKTGGGQWHIDYVYLSAGRTQTEKTVGDVAFVSVPQTLLNGYTAIPYNQFDSTVIKDVISFKAANLSANTLSCRYYNTIVDVATGQEVSREPQTGEANANIYPYSVNGFYMNPDISTRSQQYFFPDVADGEKEYEITHVLKSGILTDLIPANDTVRTRQIFGREFAFDDGTSEQGLGFTSANSIVAGAFTLVRQDTLSGLNICFNKSHNNYNEVSFNIYIWKASEQDRIPENLIDSIINVTVRYSDENNGFVKYYFADTLILPPATYFWGIKQRTSQFLNIGFDQNNNSSEYSKYYYYNSDIMDWEWQTPYYFGTAMVRPFFGAPQKTNNETVQNTAREQLKIQVFPNPATDNITLKFPQQITATMPLYISDISGRTVLSATVKVESGQLSISVKTLLRGMYFVKAGIYSTKIIVW